MSGGADRTAYDVNEISKMEMLNAAYDKDSAEVLRRIDEGVHVDSFDGDRVTALQIAASTGNSSLVASLLERQADIDLCNQFGWTPFLLACREGHVKVIEILLQRGADVQKLTYLGTSGLTLAAGAGHAEVVRKLIGLRVTMGRKQYSPTPLIAAAFRGNPSILSMLVKLGKAPICEVQDALYNLSPLTCAVMCSSVTMVYSLLELGADSAQRGLKNKSAVELAEFQQRYEILDVFREYNSKRNIPTQATDIRQLILKDDLETLRKSVEVNEVPPDGVPPIVFASAVGKISAVRLIVSISGAMVNSYEQRLRLNSLMLAALFRDAEMCEFLIQCDASVTGMTTLNQTAYDLLHISLEDADPDLRSLLSVIPGRQKLKLSQNSSTLTKLFNTGKQKFGMMPEKDEGAAPIRMRDWVKSRQKECPQIGRNHTKLVVVEDVLRGKRDLEKRRHRPLNRHLDLARTLVEESKSFMMTCFYDMYNREEGRQMKEGEGATADSIDEASSLSMQYCYRGKKREGSASSNWNGVRAWAVGSGSSGGIGRLRKQDGTARNTPRMVKKRECLPPSEDTRRSYAEEAAVIRKSSSTPQLAVSTRRLIERRSTFSQSAASAELRRRGLEHLICYFEMEEIEQDEFVNVYNDEDFRKMGIVADDCRRLQEVQSALRQNSARPPRPSFFS